MQALQTESHAGDLPPKASLVRVTPHNLVLTAMKKSEDGNSLILRFYEWAGQATQARIRIPGGATKASATNLMEQDDSVTSSQPSLQDNELVVDVGAYSINTVRLQYPTHGETFWHLRGASANNIH